jgi:hypothetical protein
MRLKWLLLLLILTTFISCEKEKSIEFTLYLNYVASYNECKTFKIYIDDQQKFNNQLCFEGATPCAKIIKFQLEPGSHIIKVEASGIIDVFIQTVDFDNGKPFGYLNYRQEISRFDFFLKSTGGLD